MPIDPKLVTTAFEIPGSRITKNLGVVRGIVVRSRSIIGTVGASLQTLLGGNITLYTELCERAFAKSGRRPRVDLDWLNRFAYSQLVLIRPDFSPAAKRRRQLLSLPGVVSSALKYWR